MSKERKKLVKQLDDIFSLYIRARDNYTCCVCGGKKPVVVIQCGHFHSRKHYSTRWDELNAMAQCASCNLYHNQDKEPMRQAFLRRYTQHQYDMLYIKFRKTTKFSDADLKFLIGLYKDKLGEFKDS